MPKTPGVGWSEHTRTKQQHFHTIISEHIDICRKLLWQRFTNRFYFYFDLNAGYGLHPVYGYGSPFLFLNAALEQRIPFQSVFIEQDPQIAHDLTRNVTQHYRDQHILDSVWVLNTSNLALEPAFFQSYGDIYVSNAKKKLLGLIYADANGIPAWPTLETFSSLECFRMTDILIYLPATALKRCRRYNGCDTLLEHLNRIQKRYWRIRKPVGQWQWTFLLGTNWREFPRLEHLGFCDLNSDAGIEVLGKLTYTVEEQQALELHNISTISTDPGVACHQAAGAQ